jgi:hypothetical protein
MMAHAKPGRPRRAPAPPAVTLDSRLDGVLVRTVAAGLLSAMRRDGGAWGEVMIARVLRRFDLAPERVDDVMAAMLHAGLVHRVAGASCAWRARRDG